jgi:hypothetical protein
MNVKIITAFHGTVIHSNAYQDLDIFVPVYGGRSISLYLPNKSKAMLADNTGDNISWMNPYVGELTCIYWASKNLDKLGNPDYIGLNHYRRLFPMRQYMHVFDHETSPFMITTQHKTGIPVLRSAELEYGIGEDLEKLFEEILQTDDEKAMYDTFIEQREYPEKNLFVIPTSELDGYIKFIMRAISVLYRDFQFQYLEGLQYKRRTARLLEFVTAYYLCRLSIKGLKRLIINYEYPWKGFC